MSKKFVRQEAVRFSKLGKNRKKLQKWRKPKGRDSKMRLHRKSYSGSPTVGHRTARKDAGKIQGQTPVMIYNTSDLLKVKKDQVAILARIGARKKSEVIKLAQEKKIKISNIVGEAKRNEAGK